jgi:hypothetical protein
VKRRDFPLALAALAISCREAVAPIMGNPPQVSMGVSVFPGWANPRPEFGLVPGTQCPNQHPWEAIKTTDRVPLLGEYDERLIAVTEKRLEWMEYAGIGFACYQVEMPELEMAA